MVVFSKITGQLSGILLDEGWLTDLRTAAAGSVVARHMAPKKIKAIGVIGTGI
jgi:ornithine cyclodeaminase